MNKNLHSILHSSFFHLPPPKKSNKYKTKLKNHKILSILRRRLNEKSRFKFQPNLTDHPFEQKEREREKVQKEGRKLKRSFGRYSPSFSFPLS